MNLDIIENLVMLLAAILGLLISLFRYIDTQKRGYMYVSVYFLAYLLSSYYWTTYTLVMQDSPDVSAFIAYLGWNIGYLLLLGTSLAMRDPASKRYFNPLMLLPIPLNIFQFTIYIQFGGILNNIWEGGLATASAVFCLQSILYYVRHKKEGVRFPYVHMAILLFVATEYGMWTSSCFDWPSDLLNPYYYCAFANYLVLLILPWAVGKHYEAEGYKPPEKTSAEIRFKILLQVAVLFIICGCCIGGYYLAVWMKNSLPADNGNSQVYSIITVMLFLISVFLVVLILAVLYVITSRYKTSTDGSQKSSTVKRNRFNLIFTILVTLVLMVFAVIYNSRTFYRASVTALYETGEDKAETTAAELGNYLSNAMSTLRVVADSVELMIQNGDTQDEILDYLTTQTNKQFKQFDENFTGLYAYVRGQYMDGSGWEPPADYNPEVRDWYNIAVDAAGETIIISPYVDAQTHDVVVTIAQLLDTDGKGEYSCRDVAALDVIVNYIQELTEQVDIGGKGYAMIVNQKGMIVAHRDKELNGEDFGAMFGTKILNNILELQNGNLQAVIDGEPSTLFVSRVMDQWYVVVVVGNKELLEDVYSQLMVNVLVYLIIFVLITFFYYIGYMNEQAFNKKVEELNANRQRQEYEAEVLRLEKRSADEANKAKSSFLADMSHEIRTPINAILGMNEMVLREAGHGSIREYARNIEISGKKLLQLINSILDFSKIEDGKMEIIPVKYKVVEMISYLVNSIQERAADKGLEFKVDIDPGVPSELYGDDTRINQIILNLLTNAVKYTPEGSVTMSMKELKRENGRVLLHVEVSDTGMGIRKSDMGRLFESFERLDEQKNRNIEGTGLGMAITTKLLKLMDSELKVESEYGEGSTFWFDLWQKIENESPLGEYSLAAMEDDDADGYRESFRAPSARVLIVDDTKMNIIVAVNLLKQTEVMIDTALNGEEAIALAKENEYDLILMDQRMPGMDGTQTMAEIKKLENNKNVGIPFICLTADAIRGARERYMAEGFTDYLTKPVEGKALERTMITYLPKEKILSAGDRDSIPESEAAAGAEETQAEPSGDKSLFEALGEIGVDTEKGMSFCGDSEDIYREILADYASEYQDRRARMDEYYRDKDWENYTIYVHSLKSSSKTIGAMKLSGTAAALESASGDKDEPTIMREHDGAMKLYETVASVIKDNMDQ